MAGLKFRYAHVYTSFTFNKLDTVWDFHWYFPLKKTNYFHHSRAVRPIWLSLANSLVISLATRSLKWFQRARSCKHGILRLCWLIKSKCTLLLISKAWFSEVVKIASIGKSQSGHVKDDFSTPKLLCCSLIIGDFYDLWEPGFKDDRALCYCASWNIPLYASSIDSEVRFAFYFLFYFKCIV